MGTSSFLRNKALVFVYCLLCSCILHAQNFERYHAAKDSVIHSSFLGYSRHVSLILPKEYQAGANTKFPLIVLFDRQNQRSYNYILKTIDYLTSIEQMPASIIVGINSEMERRTLETQFAINDRNGIGDKNEQFVLKEVLSGLRIKYNCLNYSLLIGHSRYGFFTTNMFIHHAEEIDAVVSFSPFFKEGKINLVDSLATIKNQPFKHRRYYRFAIGNDYPDDYYLMSTMLENSSVSANLDISSALFKQADHNAVPGLYIAKSLYEIFEFWSRQQTEFLKNTVVVPDDITHRLMKIEENYGVQLPFSLGTLNGRGWHYYGENKFDEAIKLWEITLKVYPNFSEAHLYIASTLKELNRPFSMHIDQFNQSIEVSNFYSIDEKEELINEAKEMIK